MFVKGILASIEYGGKAHDEFIGDLKEYINQNKNSEDVLNMISPLLFAKTRDAPTCETKKKELSGKGSEKYQKWLMSIDCFEEVNK